MRKRLDPHGVFLNDYLRRLFGISVPTDLCASDLPLPSSLTQRSTGCACFDRFGPFSHACVWGLRSELETTINNNQGTQYYLPRVL